MVYGECNFNSAMKVNGTCAYKGWCQKYILFTSYGTYVSIISILVTLQINYKENVATLPRCIPKGTVR